MKQLIVSDEAKASLREIKAFSERNGGRPRGVGYVDRIIHAFSTLMVRPGRGTRRDAVLPGLRRLNVRSHAIFYLERVDSIFIVCILHQRQDHVAWFSRYDLPKGESEI
jgi:toxin ParE1/3/4